LDKTYHTPSGIIRYRVIRADEWRETLVFLPGLTADHTLFDKQMEAFAGKYNLFVWDAPGHGLSRPFRLDFSLRDKAVWLHDILRQEGLDRPVLVGQSMGGYVSQAFLEYFPGEARGFVSIDSAPLKRRYVTGWEIWLLKRTKPMFRMFPWNMLTYWGVTGVSKTPYGRALMKKMISAYQPQEYYDLSDHGFRILAQAMELDLPYHIHCPCLLICGERDEAGSAKRYNRRWAKTEGLPIVWIKGAGHNANTDQPELVNRLIGEFVEGLDKRGPAPAHSPSQ